MANVYAVKSGNWSDTTVWNTGALPTSGDIARPNNFAVVINQNITVQALRNDAIAPAIAGGTFTLTGDFTVNISLDIKCFATDLFIYNGTGTAYITGTVPSASIISSTTTNNTSTITHSGAGHLIVDMVINSCITNEINRSNILVTNGGVLSCLKIVQKGFYGNYPNNSSSILISTTIGSIINTRSIAGTSGNGFTIHSSVKCTINIEGNITGGRMQAGGTPQGGAILMTGNETVLNIIGDISNSTGGGIGICRTVYLNSSGVINMTGNIAGPTANINFQSASITLGLSTSVLNLIGNVIGDSSGSAIISSGAVTLTGNVIGGVTASAIQSSGTCTITGTVTGGIGTSVVISGGVANITGTVTGGIGTSVVISGGVANITGIITGGTANGALGINVTGGVLNHTGIAQASAFGSAIACASPTTSVVTCTGPFLRNGYTVAVASQTLKINSLYNPYFEFRKSDNTNLSYVDEDTLNFPAELDVRDGAIYASGLYIGSLKVPAPSNVRKAVLTDNTLGDAVITAEDILNEISTSNNLLAVRLRNVSTVETTGDQIASI